MKTLTQISKRIALVLRHQPESLGLTLDAHGWADVDALVAAINRITPFTHEMLETIVREDNKQRYAFSDDHARIRANQGHTIDVDVELEACTPPDMLYHGTGEKSVAAIMDKGLLPMRRLYVHLSPDEPTATLVGRRHGTPALFTIDAAAMARDGHTFYRSQNGVWLIKAVAPAYLSGLYLAGAFYPPQAFGEAREALHARRGGIV